MSEPGFDLDRARARLGSDDEEDRRRVVAEIPDEWSPGVLGLLVLALGDGSWRVRKDAVVRVARWPDADGAVASLIATLSDDSNVGLRNAAVEALAAIGRPSVAPLCTALGAGGDYKKFLIEALAAIGDRAAVPALVRALGDDDENVRASAAEALGLIGGSDAAAALRARLGSSDLLGRLAVLEALNRLAAPVPFAELVPLVAQPILRRAALEALGHSGGMDGLPYLLDGLGDRLRGTREASAVALAALHGAQTTPEARVRVEDAVRTAPRSAVDGLVAAVSADAVPVRAAAVTLLGWGGWVDAVPRLVDALRDEEIHAAAAGALVAFGPAGVGPLVELANEAGPELGGDIFALFPRIPAAAGDPRVGGLLCRALEDEDHEAATAAARALGEVGGREALAALFHALARPDTAIAGAAAHALTKLGRRYYDEVRMLIGARGIDRGPTAVLLCRVLGAVGREADRPQLLQALRADDAGLRRSAAEAVAALGPAPETREALVYALADEDGRVRAAAAEALGALGDREATPALCGATADDEPAVQIAAARALGRLNDRRAAATLNEIGRRADGAVAMHALEALGRLETGESADEALFLEALGRRDPEVVKAAVRALSGGAWPKATQGLAQALDHGRWDVRRLAAEALAARAATDAGARAALQVRSAVEEDALVREAIAAALRVIG